MLDRRHFLTATTGLAATLAFRSPLLAQLEKAPANLPDHSLLDKNEDAYWAQLRQQFLIPTDEIYLNNGTVGSSPAPVLRAILDGYNTTEKMDQPDPEDYPIWGYAAWNEFRDPLAAFVGCNRARRRILDFPRSDPSLRDRYGEGSANRSRGSRDLDVWKTHKIRIRGGDPNKLRLSTHYYLQKKDIDRFPERLDEYKHEKKLP